MVAPCRVLCGAWCAGRARPYGKTDLGFACRAGCAGGVSRSTQSRIQKQVGDVGVYSHRCLRSACPSVTAVVLFPRDRRPALHQLASDLPAIRRFVKKCQRHGAVRCCYEAGPCGFEVPRALTADHVACDVIAGADSPPRRRSHQDRPPRRRPARLLHGRRHAR